MRAATRLLILAGMAVMLSGEASAAAVLVKGIDVPDAVSADGRTMRLQGAGVRTKFLFSVYVAALYLTNSTSDAAKAVASDEPKQISLYFLRDVSADAMREAFEDGFFKNSQDKMDRLRERYERFHSMHGQEIRKGQVFTYAYLPAAGTRVVVDGKEKGVIEGRDFMEALFAVWLGEVPASYDLKRSLLGE